jgi:outer membrane autotransporter protein
MKLNHFRKLNLASAISLAITAALPAHATVQLNGDVQLTDESYTEALQWTPGNAGDALNMNNVTVDEPTKGFSGVLIKDMDGNDVLIKDSDIKGGLTGYALRIDNATDSNILVENTILGANGGKPYVLRGDTLSGTTLTLKDVTVDASVTDLTGGGSRGISLGTVSAGSDITLDNTKVVNATDAGIYITTDLNDSALTVQNGSEVSGVKDGIHAVAVSNGATLTVDNATVSGSNTAGINLETLDGAALAVQNGAQVSGGQNGNGIYIESAGNGSTVTVDNATVYAGNNAYALKLDNITDSNFTVSNSELKGTGGNPYLFASKAISGSTLTFENSSLDAANTELTGGGSRGISLGTVDNASVLTVDNTHISNVTGVGIQIDELNNSELNIQNGSQIIGDETGVYVGGSQNGIINISDSEFSVGNGSAQTFGVQVTGDNTTLNIERSNIITEGSARGRGAMALRLVDSNGATVNINDSVLSGEAKNENDEIIPSLSVYIQSTNDSRTEVRDSTLNGIIGFRDANNNVVNVYDSTVKGGVYFYYNESNAGQPHNNNVINFDNSYLEGEILNATNSGQTEGIDIQDSHVNLTNGSTWKATGKSNVENISVTDSTVDMQDAVVSADNWTSQNTDVLVNSGSSLNIDTGTGDMNVVIKSDGKELETAENTIINVNSGDMDIHADATDIGAYKYDLVEQDGKWVLVLAGTKPDDTKPDDTKPDETKPDETKPDETKPDETKPDETKPDETKPDETKPVHPVLSNSANAVLSSLAAAQASWNSQTSALYERMGSRLEKDTGGVWGTYYGNEWAGEAGESSTFNQKISGLAIGADKTLSLKSGTLTLGAAIMHDYSHLSDFDEQGSGGSMNSTALQAYGNLALDNGLFFKGTASAGRTDSKIHARSSDGSLARGDYKQTLFGLTGQAGYRYMVTENVYVAPYAQMNTYTASEADFKLDNGMKVSSDRYWSARGELGVEAGVKTLVGGITVTPHIMAAGSHEFVKNNDVHLNDLSNGFNNTVDGSGYRFGAGVEAQLTKSFSAGVNVSYSRSKDVEQRYGINAGLRYSF